MSRGPDVSIIMANYNAARYLPAAIGSVRHQSLQSWELIVVDDASTDDSVAIVQRASLDDPRIRIAVQKANRGPAAARNRGLEMASGRWIAIVDSDDLLHRQRLEILVRRAEADGAAIAADNLMVFSDASPPRPFLAERFAHTARWIDLAEFVDSNCLYARSPDLGYLKPLIRADSIRDLRYDETLRIGEDYNFLARLMARGRRLRLEPTGLYFYRKHEGSISHRLRTAEIENLREAEAQFAASVLIFEPRLHQALARRRATLESLLIYDRVIAALKAGDIARAAALASRRPHIWPLLTRPIGARCRRLFAALTRASGSERPVFDEAALQGMLLDASHAGLSGVAS